MKRTSLDTRRSNPFRQCQSMLESFPTRNVLRNSVAQFRSHRPMEQLVRDHDPQTSVSEDPRQCGRPTRRVTASTGGGSRQ